MIHTALDGHQLTHLPLGLPVFGIEGLFLVGQFPALLFERVHFGELGPIQNVIDCSLGRPVVGQLRLMLGQILF